MSEPTTPEQCPDADPLQMAQTELISAMSALHMESEPIFGPFRDACGPEGYIVSNQHHAKHAADHIAAAQAWLRRTHQ